MGKSGFCMVRVYTYGKKWFLYGKSIYIWENMLFV